MVKSVKAVVVSPVTAKEPDVSIVNDVTSLIILSNVISLPPPATTVTAPVVVQAPPSVIVSFSVI